MEDSCKVLFVCLGNICRSPLGEGIFRSLAEERGLDNSYVVDSCGTGDWHVGSRPHKDSIRVAKENGIDITGQRARQLVVSDLQRFDVIVAMDRDNRRDIRNISDSGSASIICLREYDTSSGDLDVPDPYYGNEDGFPGVYDIIERCCVRLLDSLEKD